MVITVKQPSNRNTRIIEIQKDLAAIQNLPTLELDKLIQGVKSMRSISLDALTDLRANPAFALCGPCDPCGPQGEIGIEPGY